MKRVHMRDVLIKNRTAYYSGIENIINVSPYRQTLLKCLPFVLDPSKYEIIFEDGKEKVYLNKLQEFNCKHMDPNQRIKENEKSCDPEESEDDLE